MSLQNCGLFGTCETLYQMLSSASPGIFSDIFFITVLKYSLSVRMFLLYCIFFLERGVAVLLWADGVLCKCLCKSIILEIEPSGRSSESTLSM